MNQEGFVFQAAHGDSLAKRLSGESPLGHCKRPGFCCWNVRGDVVQNTLDSLVYKS
jgi:hypothetical protein